MVIELTNENIKLQKDGTFGFRVSLGFDRFTGKRIQKRRSGFRTKREAKAAYNQLLAQGSSVATTNSNITFEEFVETIFKPWYKARVKPQTYDNRLKMLDHRFRYFHKLNMQEITALDVQRWQVRLIAEHKPTYARAVHIILSVIFDRAINLDLITKNPARMVGMSRTPQKKIEFWTKEEFQRVMNCTSKVQYSDHLAEIMLLFLFMTGLRSGEARALKWEDVNLKKGTVTVNKTLYYRNANDYELNAPKTVSGFRTIKIDPQTNEELLEWYEDQKLMAHSEFVFSFDGVPMPVKNLSDIVKGYAEKANVHPITVHGLRHSHVSLLISLGENPLVIRDRLGHKDINTTLGTYGHLYPNTDTEVANKLSGLIALQPQI
jgi:integrase